LITDTVPAALKPRRNSLGEIRLNMPVDADGEADQKGASDGRAVAA
jgi:hypothetical protein